MDNVGSNRLPLLTPRSSAQAQGVVIVRAVNNSAVVLTAGDVVVFDATAANNPIGGLISVTTTTSADDKNGIGVVAAGEVNIPVGGEFWLQVSGYHSGVNIDGTTDIANGDRISTNTTAKSAAKAASGNYSPLGIYIDAAYTTDALALKKVFLTNPLGIRGS